MVKERIKCKGRRRVLKKRSKKRYKKKIKKKRKRRRRIYVKYTQNVK